MARAEGFLAAGTTVHLQPWQPWQTCCLVGSASQQPATPHLHYQRCPPRCQSVRCLRPATTMPRSASLRHGYRESPLVRKRWTPSGTTASHGAALSQTPSQSAVAGPAPAVAECAPDFRSRCRCHWPCCLVCRTHRYGCPDAAALDQHASATASSSPSLVPVTPVTVQQMLARRTSHKTRQSH